LLTHTGSFFFIPCSGTKQHIHCIFLFEYYAVAENTHNIEKSAQATRIRKSYLKGHMSSQALGGHMPW
jgi:hypothetical protein